MKRGTRKTNFMEANEGASSDVRLGQQVCEKAMVCLPHCGKMLAD